MKILKTTEPSELFVALQDTVAFSYGFRNRTFTIKEKWWNKHYPEIMEAINDIPYEFVDKIESNESSDVKPLFKPLELK